MIARALYTQFKSPCPEKQVIFSTFSSHSKACTLRTEGCWEGWSRGQYLCHFPVGIQLTPLNYKPSVV